MDEVENHINDLEHKEAKNNQSEQEETESKKKKNMGSISSLWDNFKMSNIHFLGLPEEGKEKKKKKEFYEITKRIKVIVRREREIELILVIY